MIPPDAAAWIYDVVLPSGLRDELRNGLRQHCACQGGLSGHCDKGTHDQCPRTWGWERHGQPDPDTWITNSRGMVAVARGVNPAVWRSGTPCRWLCPCPCHTTVMGLFDAPARTASRPSNGYERITSTDRIRSLETPLPSLFDALS